MDRNRIEGERWGKQLSGGVLRIQLYCFNVLVVSVYLAVVALGPGFKLRWGRRVKKSKKTENLEGTLRDQNGKRMVGNILTRPPLVSCLVF